MPLRPAAIVFRIAAWVLAVTSTVTGIVFVNTATAVKWTSNGDGSESGEAYDIVGVGTGLLCAGLLILAALLIIEGYRPRHADSD